MRSNSRVSVQTNKLSRVANTWRSCAHRSRVVAATGPENGELKRHFSYQAKTNWDVCDVLFKNVTETIS